MGVRLRVLGVGADAERGTEVGVFCESGTLKVGDRVTRATTTSGEDRAVDLEVVEIRFFDQLVDELAEVFSGTVLFTGEDGVEDDWLLEVAPRPGST